MKKILLLALFFVGISTISYSQSAGKGSSERSGGFFSRFRGGKKPRGQMSHFDKQRSDPNMQNNGTSYRKSRKSEYVVDGDGFGTAKQGKKGRRKRGK